MKVILVGVGQTLYFLGRNFASKGYDLTIINEEKTECVNLARTLTAKIICGDGSDPLILEEAGARESDVLLAATSRDHDNLLICQTGSKKFNIPKVIAMANDPDNVEVFEKLGVSSFSTTNIIGSLIEQKAALGDVTNLIPIAQGQVNITEILITAESPAVGKTLMQLETPQNSLVAVIIRNDEPIIPRGGNFVLENDRLVLISLSENHGKALKVFTGEGSK